jgi:hypothetical protein
MAKFNIRIDPLWKAPFLLIGATQAKSWVDVADDELDIRMGVGHEHIPLSNVASVSPHEWSLFYGLGHRTAYGGIGYVGSTENVIEIKLKQPQKFNLLLGIMGSYGSFFVSVEDPDAFMAAVRSAIAPAA